MTTIVFMIYALTFLIDNLVLGPLTKKKKKNQMKTKNAQKIIIKQCESEDKDELGYKEV